MAENRQYCEDSVTVGGVARLWDCRATLIGGV